MKPDCTVSEHGQLNPVDRLSDLPDFVLHHILSFLDKEEVYRTSILSKRWVNISATFPALHFSYRNFTNGISALMEYMETTLQRYSREGLRITKLTLEFPPINAGELACKLDEWLKIAAHNQVVELEIRGPAKYKLPGILFSAKSLKCLDCSDVKIPYYKAIDLAYLQSLDLTSVFIGDAMLNHIISSCLLLKNLGLNFCSGFKNMVVPHYSKLETLDLGDIFPITVILETLTLLCFQYVAMENHYERWPVISKASFLRNLRILEIYFSNITDEVVGALLSELTLLETLKFSSCHMLTTIRVSRHSSTRLKEINLERCSGLLDVRIDAPSLRKLRYWGDFDPSLSFAINSLANCDISLNIPPEDLSNEGFLKLKKLLIGLTSCIVLKISLLDDFVESKYVDIQFDEELEEKHLGPPCYVRELKLKVSSWTFSESSVTAFLDGLFWTCRPDVIVLLGAPDKTIESLIRKLKDMAECRSHPLKRVEAEAANCSKLLDGGKFDEQLRLYW